MKLVLGTMTFGPQVNPEDSKLILNLFLDAGYREIDSAYVYNNGDTEKILGDIFPNDNTIFDISTKANPRITGKLDKSAVIDQLNESLVRFKKESVDILYFHFPDPKTPIEEPLEAFNELYKQGKVKELGLSNFPAWKVVEIYYLCKQKNWQVPTVYQGLYNGLSRKVENELFPAIRELGMRFYAFNPLAGGLLSGKYNNFEEAPAEGRFTLRPNYQDRYWKKSFFNALNTLAVECEKFKIPIAEAAYRWLAFHSQLEESLGDGIIIGASKVKQVEQNIQAIKKGILPLSVVNSFEIAWEEAAADCPDYFKYIT